MEKNKNFKLFRLLRIRHLILRMSDMTFSARSLYKWSFSDSPFHRNGGDLNYWITGTPPPPPPGCPTNGRGHLAVDKNRRHIQMSISEKKERNNWSYTLWHSPCDRVEILHKTTRNSAMTARDWTGYGPNASRPRYRWVKLFGLSL